ncbi:MAG: sugar isomerase [Proteobacteria bacterium]|nr:sugar isomerase [Pseudomonadota bacterium]
MKINEDLLAKSNQKIASECTANFNFLADQLNSKGYDVTELVSKIGQFQIATPSWALGTGGTRFGRFPGGGEPGSLEQKIDDVGLLRSLCHQTASISLHIPWDIPSDPNAIKERAASHGLVFDAINSNTFQDQPDFGNAPNKKSYKFGSLCHSEASVREQAIQHNLDCIKYGQDLGSNVLSIWLGDGTTFPGQANFRHQFQNTLSSLQTIYKSLPEDWFMFTEHKPFEPNFYSSVVNDWGSSLLLAQKTGERCLCLVDLGHHLPNTNIEQVVSRVLMEGRLAGFHFNDSKYADDDLTVGSIKPYQLFLIFNELLDHMEGDELNNPELAWMIDASHNLKDPLEDLLQSFDAIAIAYAQALLIDKKMLLEAQISNDVTMAQEILQNAYRTDVRPLVAQARKLNGAALNPIQAYRDLRVRETLIEERGTETISTGL